MSRKIFVHIGLPKTATTTLQSKYFPNLDCNFGFKYTGVFQPRGSKKEANVYKSLCHAVFNGESSAFDNAIALMPKDCRLIVSEEMFTVGQEQRSWQENLKLLQAALAGYDYRILVTLRNPVAAIFSYYVELEDVRRSVPTFDSSLVDHPILSIFKFKELDLFLEKTFSRERIFYCSFDDIISGNMGPVEDFLDLPYSNKQWSFPRSNGKVKSSSGIQFHDTKKTNLYSIISNASHRRFGKEKADRIMNLLYVTKPLLNFLGYRRKYWIPLLTNEVSDDLNNQLLDDIEFYKSHIKKDVRRDSST